MSALSVRVRTSLLTGAVPLFALAAGCSSPEASQPDVSEADVVLAYVDDGMNAAVADCLVGLASREFAFEQLLPGAAPESDAVLIEEMLRSCTDAVEILGEEDIEARQNFETGPFNIGDDSYLDALWTECERGNGASCDQLWAEAPVGSIYESFGVTCGNRPEILDCAEEMDGPDRRPPNVE